MATSQRPYPEIKAGVSHEEPDVLQGYEVRAYWTAGEGATCPASSTWTAESESLAVDEAVSVLDSCRHPRLPVRVAGVKIRPARSGPWRWVSADRTTVLAAPSSTRPEAGETYI